MLIQDLGIKSQLLLVISMHLLVFSVFGHGFLLQSSIRRL